MVRWFAFANDGISLSPKKGKNDKEESRRRLPQRQARLY